jgi:hypothetical protein
MMNNEQVMQLLVDNGLHEGGMDNWVLDNAWVQFANLVAAHEREAIAQMFEGAPALVQFAQNDKGGCLICGFTPKLAIESIRARSNI